MKVKIPPILAFALTIVALAFILKLIDAMLGLGYMIGFTAGFLYCFYFISKLRGEAEK